MITGLPPLKPITLILGSPRSGTTLLRVMLAGHPKLFSPPEMLLGQFETMRQRADHVNRRFWEKGGLRRALMELEGLDVEGAKAAVRALEDRSIPEVYARLQERLGERMLVDKCIHLAASPEALYRIPNRFPEARYLWLVRHPGSVTRSLEHQPMVEFMIDGLANDTREVWHFANHLIKQYLEMIPKNRWELILYEELITNPRPVMERVCQTLGVEFNEAVLDPYEGDRMRHDIKGARAAGDPAMAGRGRMDPELATSWLHGFDPRTLSKETHTLALEFGYDLAAMPLPPIAKVSETLSELLLTVQELEESIRIPLDLDAVEGRRFLLRILSAAVDTFVEQEDPEFPAFHHVEGPTRKMFADCQDVDYLRAPIRLGPRRAYRLWGKIPKGTLYIGIQLYGKGGSIGNRLCNEELGIDEAGNFEIFISTEEQPDVWLAADGDETAVMVRQYYTDRERQLPVTINIENIGEKKETNPLDPVHFAAGLEQAKDMIKTVFKRTTDAHKMGSMAALQHFIELPGDQLFPTPDNKYQVAYYRLAPNERMLIRGRLPKAHYFGISLCNAWLESFDYTCHRISINHSQLITGPDGAFEICLAHRNPGHDNWLDTAGHQGGYIIARSLLSEGPLPELSVQIQKEGPLK